MHTNNISQQSSTNGSACPSRAEVRAYVRHTVVLPYTSSRLDVWDGLQRADAVAGNGSLVRLFYSRGTMRGDREYDGGKGWTREHLWPQSLMVGATARQNDAPATDLYALRPALGRCNSRRSNHKFGRLPNTSQPDDLCQLACDASDAVGVCEPSDTVKGEIARALLYMAVRYDGRGDLAPIGVADDWADLRLDDVAAGGAPLLLEWDAQFPPTPSERTRNAVVAGLQGGPRNPFIDGSPGLARCVFGNATWLWPPSNFSATSDSAASNGTDGRGATSNTSAATSDDVMWRANSSLTRELSKLDDHHEMLLALGAAAVVVCLALLLHELAKRCIPPEAKRRLLEVYTPSSKERRRADENAVGVEARGVPTGTGAGASASAGADAGAADAGDAAADAEHASEAAVAGELPAGWEALFDVDGSTYYHHTLSGVTQWERPSADDGHGRSGDEKQASTLWDQAEAAVVADTDAAHAGGGPRRLAEEDAGKRSAMATHRL